MRRIWAISLYTYKLYKYMKKKETEKGIGIKTFVKR